MSLIPSLILDISFSTKVRRHVFTYSLVVPLIQLFLTFSYFHRRLEFSNWTQRYMRKCDYSFCLLELVLCMLKHWFYTLIGGWRMTQCFYNNNNNPLWTKIWASTLQHIYTILSLLICTWMDARELDNILILRVQSLMAMHPFIKCHTTLAKVEASMLLCQQHRFCFNVSHVFLFIFLVHIYPSMWLGMHLTRQHNVYWNLFPLHIIYMCCIKHISEATFNATPIPLS
mgnify:CR=1 FL=1